MNLAALTDSQLFAEAVTACKQAAQGEANGGDDTTYYHAMAVMRESQRRHVAAGHAQRCEGDIYSRALRQAQADMLGSAWPTPECTCGAAS